MGESGISEKELLKFDAYDVFGYLIPGSVLCGGIWIYGQLARSADDPFVRLLSGLSFDVNSVPVAVGLTLWFLFILYIGGHVVAAFGAAVLDKLIVERTQGFPYEQLFEAPGRQWVTKYERGRRDIYKMVFSIGIAGLSWMGYHGPTRANVWIMIGIVIALLLLKGLYNRRQNKVWSPQKEDPPDRLLSMLAKLAFPFDKVTYLFVGVFMRRKKFPKSTQDEFERVFVRTFRVNPQQAATDVFWFCYAYLCEHRHPSAKLIQHWLRLYAFARNLSVAFLLLYIYGLMTDQLVADRDFSRAWYLTTGACFLLFGARFYYLYYNYYSKFTFRAFIVGAQDEAKAGELKVSGTISRASQRNVGDTEKPQP